MTVADPRSPLYGQYYSVDALADIVAPPPEDINTVLDFVKDRCPDAKIEVSWCLALDDFEVSEFYVAVANTRHC